MFYFPTDLMFPTVKIIFDVKRKKYNYKTDNRVCKRCQIYLLGKKKTCLGVLDRGERDNDNETGLEEGGGIEMSTTSAPFACRSFA